MIDWTSLIFPNVEIDLPVGSIVYINQDGSIEQMIEKGHNLKYNDEGSFTENVNIRNTSRGLRIDGNPSKWLQGHNLFGRDSWLVVGLWVRDICRRLNNNISILRAFERGDYRVTRIDITYNYTVPGVNAYLDALSQFASGSRGRPERSKGTTVYFHKSSRRSSVKFYNKETEILVHPFNPHRIDQVREQLLKEYSKDLLRCEVCLRGKYLDETYGYKINWNEFNFYGAWKKRVDQITFPTSVELRGDSMDAIPGRHRIVYLAWRNGDDVKELLPRTTFWRAKKFFLGYGLDITKPVPKVAQCCIIPLFRPVDAVFKEIPQEAYQLKLVA